MKVELRINSKDNIIFALFSLWLIVDSANGFLMRNEFPFPLSQVYKLLVALIVTIRIADIGNMRGYYGLTFLYLILYSVNVLINGEELGPSLVLISKLLTTLLFFCYFRIVAKSNLQYFKAHFGKVIKINLVVFLVNILAGLVGIGYKAYTDGEGFGSCGFFYAVNELSGVVAALFPWAFYFFRVKYSNKVYLLVSGVLFVAAYLLSSKAGIIATLLSFIMISYFYGSKSEKRLVVLLSGILIISGVVYIQILLSSEVAIMQRFSWFMEQNGVFGALTSGRFGYWEEEGGDLWNAGPIAIIIGVGGNRTVEMDPFDALLNMGVVGFAWLIIVYLKGIIRPLRRCYKRMEYSKVIFTSNILLVLVSVIAGHVLFSSMAGLFIAMSNSWLIIKNEKNISSCQPVSV